MAITSTISAIVDTLRSIGKYPVYDVAMEEYLQYDRSDEYAIVVSEEGAEYAVSDDSSRLYNVTEEYSIGLLVHLFSGEDNDAHAIARVMLDDVLSVITQRVSGTSPIVRNWARVGENSLNRAQYEIRITYNYEKDTR